MSRTVLLLAVIFLTFSAINDLSSEEIKKAVVAGSFYPAQPLLLAGQIDKYLNDAKTKKIDGEIIALISPHAGYIYSGPVAAYGYKLISTEKFDTVVIIASSHYLRFEGAAALKSDFYETPLGRIAIDSDFTSRLVKFKKGLVNFEPDAFAQEHAAEVQIPFLQRTLQDFKIVPIIIGKPDYKACENLADALVDVIKKGGKKVLMIASTDLSHYYSYNDAVIKDEITLSEIMNFNPERFAARVSSGECELCGSAAVVTTLLAAKKLGASKIELLKYANSGDTAGDKTRVVGYGSIVVYREEAKMLSSAQKVRLLEIARQTIERYIKEGKIAEFKENDPALVKVQGAFVTLRKKGELRGCIGNIIGEQPLYLTVRDMAIESSSRDPRFPPVTPNELKEIKVEISVLSPPQRVNNPEEIKMGTHGVIVRRGFHSGVFLPQVATETGWTKEEFLSNLCSHKAGLPSGAWKDKDTELYTFTAEVFEEGE